MAKKIIVIGSGLGGLASALRMRAKGFDVTLVEKHPDLGGRARVFKKDKFIYDGGPTVITAPHLFEELFSLFDKKISDYVKIVPLDLWYRLFLAMARHLIIMEMTNLWKNRLKKSPQGIITVIKSSLVLLRKFSIKVSLTSLINHLII